MEESQSESLSNCRNVAEVADYVKNKVELCIQNYMSFDVTAKYLEKNHRISRSVTHIVWEQLREENPDFFNHFEFRCQIALQMRMFNDLLTKQGVGMFENGLLDICDASPSVKALLRRQHPERVHLLETLASKTKLSSVSLVALPYTNGTNFVVQTQILNNQQNQVLNHASFAMPNPNGPLVAPSQNPYNHQEQVLNPASFAMPNPNGLSAAQSLIPYDQQNQVIPSERLPLASANGPSMTQLLIPNNQQNEPHHNPLPAYNNDHNSPTFAPTDTDDWFDPAAFEDLATLPPLPPADTNQWSSSGDLPYTAATMPVEDLSTFDLDCDIGHNGPRFLDADTILAGMDFNEHLSGQYQPHWQQQQQQQNVQVKGSNGLVNGESNVEHHQCVDHQQQAGGGGIQRHYPESEALNNLENTGHNGVSDSYIKSAAQPQPIEQTQQHQNGHYQLPQNSGGRSNGVVNGESSGQQLCNNFDRTHSERMCTSVVDQQQQAGRVKCHHPESEALNNPNNGDRTQTRGVKQQRSPKERATTRSLKEWEQYESEETKQ